jgi:hypothetical protein
MIEIQENFNPYAKKFYNWFNEISPQVKNEFEKLGFFFVGEQKSPKSLTIYLVFQTHVKNQRFKVRFSDHKLFDYSQYQKCFAIDDVIMGESFEMGNKYYYRDVMLDLFNAKKHEKIN